jgi:hypothetical protein
LKQRCQLVQGNPYSLNNHEDLSACVIQRMVRGRLVRNYVKRYKFVKNWIPHCVQRNSAEANAVQVSTWGISSQSFVQKLNQLSKLPKQVRDLENVVLRDRKFVQIMAARTIQNAWYDSPLSLSKITHCGQTRSRF